MDEIHFAPPKLGNDTIPMQIPTNNGFNHGSKWCRISPIHSRDWSASSFVGELRQPSSQVVLLGVLSFFVGN